MHQIALGLRNWLGLRTGKFYYYARLIRLVGSYYFVKTFVQLVPVVHICDMFTKPERHIQLKYIRGFFALTALFLLMLSTLPQVNAFLREMNAVHCNGDCSMEDDSDQTVVVIELREIEESETREESSDSIHFLFSELLPVITCFVFAELPVQQNLVASSITPSALSFEDYCVLHGVWRI